MNIQCQHLNTIKCREFDIVHYKYTIEIALINYIIPCRELDILPYKVEIKYTNKITL